MSGQSFNYGDINIEGGNAHFGHNYATLNIIANDGLGSFIPTPEETAKYLYLKP